MSSSLEVDLIVENIRDISIEMGLSWVSYLPRLILIKKIHVFVIIVQQFKTDVEL